MMMNSSARSHSLLAANRTGVVLYAVLIVVVILALAGYQYVELMSSEFRAAESNVRAAQSRSLAISGVHYAAAALSDPTTFSGKLNSNPFDNEGVFHNVVVRDDDRARYKGMFSLVAPPSPDDAVGGSSTFRYGITDESGKINLNALVTSGASLDRVHDLLMKLPNMSDDIADAIIDWISSDEAQARPNGAKDSYYSSLSPGYRCKNGPLDSLEELLLVRGVTPDLLFGTDKNRNGIQDPEDNSSNGFDPGWAAYLTVYSRDKSIDSDGNAKINLNDNDLQSLYDKLNTALGEELATWIVAYRIYGSGSGGNMQAGGKLTKDQLDFKRSGGTRISSMYSLLSTRVAIPQSNGGNTASVSSSNTTAASSSSAASGTPSASSGASTGSAASGAAQKGGSGTQSGGGSGGGTNRQITKTYNSPMQVESQRDQLLPLLLDKCTTSSKSEVPARINVITAPKSVLTCLTAVGSLEDADVDAIMTSRPTPGNYDASDLKYKTTAWLLIDAKISATKLQALENYITSRTQTYRVQSMGYFQEGGPVTRVEAVVDTNGGSPRIIYFRDLTPLGRGYEVPR